MVRFAVMLPHKKHTAPISAANAVCHSNNTMLSATRESKPETCEV